MKGRVLIVAGSDSGGGAGIQADIKTVTALGGFAATAITALTAQNTQGVFGIHGVPTEFIQQQMRLVLDDIGADAIKIGMLGDSATIDAVAEVLEALPQRPPVVVDPVMVAQSGDALLEPGTEARLVERMLPLADVLTPNLPEASRLTGIDVAGPESMLVAAEAMRATGAKTVLVKGGHMEGDILVDLLLHGGGISRYESPRIPTRHTHGTGCTLASAIACGLAQELEVEPAVRRARLYLQESIRRAPGLGKGDGPVDHWAGAAAVGPL